MIHRAAIVTHLQHSLPNALAVYAFGSRISGEDNSDSDLDLAVLVAGRYSKRGVGLWSMAC